ncbi:MAG TPA: glutamyl-tRNA reductase [Cytophagales bacterium]|nr:glutamyl-tRNA reductase [Cytophagales bacterium]
MPVFSKKNKSTVKPNFQGISISHRTTTVVDREQYALDAAGREQLLLSLRDLGGVQEALVLSTCNRTEVYVVSDTLTPADLFSFLCLSKGIPSTPDKISHYVGLADTEATAHHLFRVGAGLESTILGDQQIAGQIKESYQATCDLGMADTYLHRLMHTLFFTQKRIVNQTEFRAGAASVSYAAVQVALEAAQKFVQPAVLILGAGEMGSDVCRHLAKHHPAPITVANRTPGKAKALAEETGIKYLSMEAALSKVDQFPIVISTVSAPDPILTLQNTSRRMGPQWIIDLSVPRSVHATVGTQENIHVVDVDHIQAQTDAVLARRQAAIPAVEALVNEGLAEVHQWQQQQMFSPIIKEVKETLQEIRAGELARYLQKLSVEDHSLVEALTQNIIQKVLKIPVLQLKAACQRGEEGPLVDALRVLFDLEKDTKIHAKS